MDTKKGRQQDTSTRPSDPGRSPPRDKAAQTTPSTTAQPQQAADVPDAAPGRQYQGSGVTNKAGRFGSSKRPDDLTGPGAGGSTKKR